MNITALVLSSLLRWEFARQRQRLANDFKPMTFQRLLTLAAMQWPVAGWRTSRRFTPDLRTTALRVPGLEYFPAANNA